MDLLTIDAVSAATGVSRSGLAKWRMAGTGPAFIKVGRAVRYCRHDVDAWLATRRRSATWQSIPANDNAPASKQGVA